MTNLFNTLMQYRATFWIDIPRQLFAWIDSAIYWLISSVYGLIEDLARIQIFRESTLNNFYNKIYLLLSIFMLFKVSFSIVSYILDPAKVVDKNSGFGKIITNVVIMFVMILSAPIAFKYLTKLQNAILDDDIILNFIFGDVGSTNVNNEIQLADSERCQEWSNIHDGMRKYNPASPGMSIANNNGDYLAVTIYRVFFTLADTKVETGKGMDDHKNDGKTLDVKKGKYVFDFMCNDNNTHISVSDMASFVNAYVDEINEVGSNGYYLIEYKVFVATAVGGFALLMLINIAFETSVRAIKLGFYQLIAPIPIISYIDPNSSKNGVFSKYIKALGKTWISLFIRLFSLYFAIFVIKEFNTNFVQDLGEVHSSKFFITLFVIIGALMFAKQLPQFIEELFPGMKMGKMQLNPFKNIAENAVGGKLLLGAGAAAGAAGIGAVSRMGNLAKNNIIEKLMNPDYAEKKYKKRIDRINNKAYKQIDNDEKNNKKALDYASKAAFYGVNGKKRKQERYINKAEKMNQKTEKQFAKNVKKTDDALRKYQDAAVLRESMGKLKKNINDFFENNKVGRGLSTAKNVVVQTGTIISQGLTAASIGFKDAGNLKFSVKKIGHESARIRNYKDEYNMMDRFKDSMTDFFGVRGSSGTSSEIANKITDLTMDLNKINQSLNSIGTSIANLQANTNVAGMTEVVDGKLTINQNYSGTPENMKIYDRLKELYSQQEQLITAKQDTEKAIKKQEKIKGMPGDLKK